MSSNHQGLFWLTIASTLATAAIGYSIYSQSTKINQRCKVLFSKKNSYINNPKNVLDYKVQGDKLDATSVQLKKDIQNIINQIIPDANQIGIDDFEIQQLSGGISNLLFLAVIKSLNIQVIIRIYGPGTSKFVNRDVENIVFSALSQARISPTFYGVFSNGRLEQFLPGSCFK